MQTIVRWVSTLALLVLPLVPALAGQSSWNPKADPPGLVLSLGGGTVRETFDLPPGATELVLTLKTFLLEDIRLVEVWSTDGQLWVREEKKIPGDQSTERVNLPPGHQITLEIRTLAGTPVASIRLRRK